MNAPALPFTFTLLAVTICAVWLPPLRLTRGRTLHAWPPLFLATIAAALSARHLTALGVMALIVTATAIYAIDRAPNPPSRAVATLLTISLTLMLALHLLPGFSNPMLLNAVRFTPDAQPYTQYANFDKASAGLLLLALAIDRARTARDWRRLLTQSSSTILATTAAVMCAASALGYVRFEPKLPAATWLFIVVNLLFVCVAEEAFFRGFLQARLARLLTARGFRAANAAALAACALLFGVAHFAGGWSYILLATIAGAGYGYAYLCTQRVEAAILAHFTVNLVHFIGFTYPAISH